MLCKDQAYINRVFKFFSKSFMRSTAELRWCNCLQIRFCTNWVGANWIKLFLGVIYNVYQKMTSCLMNETYLQVQIKLGFSRMALSTMTIIRIKIIHQNQCHSSELMTFIKIKIIHQNQCHSSKSRSFIRINVIHQN